ncbi:MAG: tetratricopeptide repeat protein [Verrucomicrobia bacterium]|nr:tetratricopeptide repeat protein [Verrucomicrobiota bacterium]
MPPAAPQSTPLDAAIALQRAGRGVEALAHYRRLRPKYPKDFRLLHLGGTALLQTGQAGEAAEWLESAARINPRMGATQMCLALALSQCDRRDAAAARFREAIKLDAGNVEVWTNYAMFLLNGGQPVEALEALERAVKLKPDAAAPLRLLGRVLLALARPVEALARQDRALALAPKEAASHTARAQALYGCHRIDEARAEFERAMALDPGDFQAASYRLMTLHYLDDLSREQIAEEHRAFGRRCPAPSSAAAQARAGQRDPTKRLRVAFLSPDLRTHSVAFFLEPLLEHLPKEEIEVVLYHDHFCRDETSARLRARASIWREFGGRDDAWVERTVRADAPDVLIDLAGHTGFNRQPLLARRLAPVQVTYLGYPDTTGGRAMDFRFTDEWADPTGEADGLHTERLVRFAPTAWCYQPPRTAPAVVAPPCVRGAAPVFGSFNNFSKLSPATLRLWARLLEAVPGARLLLKGQEADSVVARRAAEAGIAPERLVILPPTVGLAEHLATYARIDVALDPLPYHGTTTTCEALWMGRPVVTLAGDRHVRRVGVSLLQAAGQADCVAQTLDDYVARAAALAGDPAGLAARSAGLRAQLAAGPLLDHAGQARRFSDALRACWLGVNDLHATA